MHNSIERSMPDFHWLLLIIAVAVILGLLALGTTFFTRLVPEIMERAHFQSFPFWPAGR
jgi:hypothetical protein